MRRLHLFEIEDLPKCPAWIRIAITDMLLVIHRWFGTAEKLRADLKAIVPPNEPVFIVDLCSGSGGPMPDAVESLRSEPEFEQVHLFLTDLYPNQATIDRTRSRHETTPMTIEQNDGATGIKHDSPWLHYVAQSVAAADCNEVGYDGWKSVQTMICCFHHMPVEQARSILLAAQKTRRPMLIFEMTDNSIPPRWLWWAGLFPNFLMGLVVAAFVRPLTWRHLFFSFVIPVIPACFAWDGTVSNIRTYGRSDFEALVEPIRDSSYQWECRIQPGSMVNHWVICGQPTLANADSMDDIGQDIACEKPD